MPQINIKKQMITMTILIGVLIFAIGFFVILPSIQTIRELKKNINDTQKFLEEQYEKTQRMRRSVHNLNDIVLQIAKFDKLSIKEGSELEIITQLEELASKHNINQTLRVTFYNASENPTQPKDLPPLLNKKNYYIFSFNNTGSYENLAKFMKSVEELPYYFIIDSVQMSKISERTDVTLRFDGILYIIDDK